MSSKKQLLLVGKSLEHSFSQKYFTEKFRSTALDDWSYANYELDDISDISKLKLQEDLVGFNVTIPYKSAILPYLDSLDDNAKEIGAVNTVKCLRVNGNVHFKGFNTDSSAFAKTILPYRDKIAGSLVLGNGGAAKAIIASLTEMSINFKVISRSGNIKYADILSEWYAQFNLIINCTPLGMYPDVDSYPKIVYSQLNSNSILYDLVYNPEETEFIKRGLEENAFCLNGLKMLKLQAEMAFDIWSKQT